MSSTAIYDGGYYCRGCGRELPAQFRGLFHEECLKVDKRRRVREQRQREQERFLGWLKKQECRNCGVRIGDVAKSDGLTGSPCEGSQRTKAASS
jgi:hypothetical protein